MLFTTRRPRYRPSNNVRALLIWSLTCVSVFSVLDGIATRRVPVYVEEFRKLGMDDEQTLSIALQVAYDLEPNGWWINGKRPYLVFDATRRYSISEEMYEAFDLQMVEDAYQRPVAILKPRIATLLAP